MPKPINQLRTHMNRILRGMDYDLSFRVRVTVPVTISFGPVEHETDLPLVITDEGEASVIEPEKQMRRIEEEFFDELVGDDPRYDYNPKQAAP